MGMSRQGFDPAVAAVLFGLAGLLIVLLQTLETLSARVAFIMVTGILLAYLWTQVLQVRRVHGERWLLNPVVLCSGMTFFMSFGLGNVLFFLPPETLELLGAVPDVNAAMLKLMWLVLLGAIGMWLGYWSRLASYLSNSAHRRKVAKLFRKSNEPHTWAVPALLLIGLIARLISVRLGLFGYSSSYERLTEMQAITQYVSMLSGLGKLALVIAALQYYSARKSARTTILFYVVLIVEVAFGLLSGFKTAVAAPFLIVGVCQYLMTNTLPKKWIVFVFVGVFAAYLVIEPFRESRSNDSSFKGTSISEIASVMLGAANMHRSSSSDDDRPGVLLNFVARSSLAYVGSVGIEFADDTPTMPEGSPNFVENILYAPLYAWIPRFIWSSKPLGDLGLWYTQVVLGYAGSFSSTAMSPFTYLYFAGGSLAVFFGFMFIGVAQRLLLFLMQPYIYLSGAVVFLGVLQPLSVIPDGFDGLVIQLMRDLPLLLILQRILFRRGLATALANGQTAATPRENCAQAGRRVSGGRACVD